MITSLNIKMLLRQLRLHVVTLYAVQDCDNCYHSSIRYIRRIRLNASREETAASIC